MALTECHSNKQTNVVNKQGGKSDDLPNMSVDGKKFRETLPLGADEWHEFPCSPCAREDRNVPAIKFCVECDENLCSTCLKDHNKFAKMRVHQITGNLSSRAGQGKDLPTQRCDRHGGKLIDVYCINHDVVGCSTCFNVEHGSCEGIQYIPDMTPVMHGNTEMSDLETKMTQLLAHFDRLKRQKQDNLKLLQQEKDKLITEVKALRKKINSKLDEMEQAIVNEIETKLGMRTRDVSKDIDVINNEMTSLEERQRSLQAAKRGNNTELFVQLKMGQSLVQANERMFKSVSTGSNALNMQVLLDSNITTLLQTNNAALGSISEIFIPKSTTYDRDVNIRLPSEKEKCYINAICLTLKGDVYLADHGNCSIKKLGESLTVTEHFELPDRPFGLCEVENNRLAVTLYNDKKVQFLSQNPVSRGESFSVGDCCSGIDCHNGQLYVCCGGYKEQGDGPGCIEVYSMGGELLRVYYQGASIPLFVHVSDRGDVLISNRGSKNLISLRMDDHSVSNLQIKALLQPAGMFRLSDNLLCVAGCKTNNTMLISADGEHQQELLTEKDGISKPLAVCLDRHRSRLFVANNESDIIKIFKVIT